MMTEALLRSIKQSIVPTKKLLIGSYPAELTENVCNGINCYAYALGIMYTPRIGEFFSYCPGFTVDNSIKWEKDIMRAIQTDLDSLDIKYRKFSLGNSMPLQPNEYLIKVFTRGKSDFHFVRYDPATGIWFHKERFNTPTPMSRYSIEKSSYYGDSEPASHYYGTYWPCGYFSIEEPSN